MRSGRFLAFVAVLLVLTIAPAASAGTPTASEMQTYLRAVHPIYSSFHGETTRISAAADNVDFTKTGSAKALAAKLDRSAAVLTALAGRMSKVNPPAALSAAHRSFRSAFLQYASGERIFAAGLRGADFEKATARMETVADAIGSKLEHWQTATVAVLRRLHSTVPLWVKQVV